MTGSSPPRLAVALLRRFLHDNEPLVGDLLEGFSVRRSRLWFWRQVVLAIAMRSSRQRDRESPLGLVERSTFVPCEPRRKLEPAWRINLTASPLPYVGGHGLVALGVHATLVRPEMWWIFPPAIFGGVALGLAMTIVRRRAVLTSPAHVGRTLFADWDRAEDAPES